MATTNARAETIGLSELERNIDVPPGCLRIGADLVGILDDGLCYGTIDPGQADRQASLQEELAARRAEVDFRIDGGVGGKPELAFRRRLCHGADKTCRPAGCKKLFGIRARLSAARRRELDAQRAIIALRRSVTPAGRVGLAGIKNSFDLGHGRLLSFAAAAAFRDRSFVMDQRIRHVSGNCETVSKSIGALSLVIVDPHPCQGKATSAASPPPCLL
ncbi:hypothetical protein AGR4A_Lc10097 [Agrobacterium tumefaciens str. B6]|uniref:Uncharacterized protein n=1 Tax=Agrobacterium tumefaciens str. B6 TaxID=1183423 RepID=A0A822V695_AGRTU|nr:hypothetical protein AGR4A_Lc10097 [Agrobacterium tumefaciens str. B6]